MTRILIEFALVVGALGVGVFASQKIKDLIAGIPADLRAKLDRAEAAAVAKLPTGPTGPQSKV